MLKSTNYQLTTSCLYKVGTEVILHHYVLEHEIPMIFEEEHEGFVGGNYAWKSITKNIFQVGIRWSTLH